MLSQHRTSHTDRQTDTNSWWINKDSPQRGITWKVDVIFASGINKLENLSFVNVMPQPKAQPPSIQLHPHQALMAYNHENSSLQGNHWPPKANTHIYGPFSVDGYQSDGFQSFTTICKLVSLRFSKLYQILHNYQLILKLPRLFMKRVPVQCSFPFTESKVKEPVKS